MKAKEFNYNGHFIQKDAYGCGVYAVANALQEESFITLDRLKQSKDGNNLGQLNKWLVEDGHNLFLEPLYFSSTGKRLPNNICDLAPAGEGVSSMPILIDIQFSKGGKMHFVAGELMPTRDLIIIDSLNHSQLEITTLSKYNRKYYRTFGLYHFRNIDTGNYLMRFID